MNTNNHAAIINDIRKVDDPYEEFVGNGEACRFCFARKGRLIRVECIWRRATYMSQAGREDEG